MFYYFTIYSCRNVLIFIVITLILDSILKAKAKSITCHQVGIGYWSQKTSEVKTCYIQETSIESSGVKFSTNDAAISGLDINNNKKIFYLPENVAESLPLLIGYSVQRCSVKHILKIHFSGMTKLTQLYLNNNQIERIENSVFDDLISLESIGLGE